MGDHRDQKNPVVPFRPPDHLANGVFFDQTKPDQKMNLDFLYENDGIENTLLLSENLNAGFCFDTHESSIGFVWIDSFKNGIAARDDQALLGINQRHYGMRYPKTGILGLRILMIGQTLM